MRRYVHVISLSTEYIDREPGSEQYEWLERDLASVDRAARDETAPPLMWHPWLRPPPRVSPP